MDEDIIYCSDCQTELHKEDIGKTYINDMEAEPICRKCAETTWDRKCVRCGTFFNSDNYCPTCEEDDEKELKGRKATKKDIDELFDIYVQLEK